MASLPHRRQRPGDCRFRGTGAPWITGRVVDGIAEGTLTLNQLWFNVGIVIAVAVVSYVMRVVWRVSLFGASYALSNRLRRDIYRHLTRQSSTFFKSTTPAI